MRQGATVISALKNKKLEPHAQFLTFHAIPDVRSTEKWNTYKFVKRGIFSPL